MRLHRRARAAVRQRLRGRIVLGVMLRLPAGRGPGLWRRFADRARVAAADQLLLQAGDFEGAQEAVRPLLDSSRVKSRAWGIVATAREKQGDPHGALDAARRATGAEQVRVAELLLHRRAAALAGEDVEADAVLRRLSETPPKTVKDFEVTVAAISDAGPDGLLAEYERSLSGWGVEFDPERFREVEAERQLAARTGTDSVARIPSSRPAHPARSLAARRTRHRAASGRPPSQSAASRRNSACRQQGCRPSIARDWRAIASSHTTAAIACRRQPPQYFSA